MDVAKDALKWASVGLYTTLAFPSAAAVSYATERGARRILRTWSQASLRSLGLTLSFDDQNLGCYDDPPYLFVHLNQTSLIETFIFGGALPLLPRMVVNIEYAMLPVIGPSMVAMGSRVLIRQRPAQAKQVMNRVAEDMRMRKRSFGMSIEGRRSRDGSLSPYKKGAAVLAISAQARIVPLYIHGGYEALPMGRWRVRPGHLHVVTFPWIDMRGKRLEDRDAVTEQLRTIAEIEQNRA